MDIRLNDFAVMILTHGRANHVYTYKTLKECGYTGKIYFVLDDEDDQYEQYAQKFGRDNIKVFCKNEWMKKIDTMDNFGKKGVILFARNACFQIAKDIGLKYFLQFDDDYTSIEHRYFKDGETKKKLGVKKCKDADRLFGDMIDFLIESDADTVALSQGGDFIGGADNKSITDGLRRKAMNSFFCRTDRPVNFVGTINEDVNTYTLDGSRGKLFLSITNMAIVQKATQSNKGGMTETYLDSGTYLKSFYSVIGMPSAVKIAIMGDKHYRIHHHVKWDNCIPVIIQDKYRKWS